MLTEKLKLDGVEFDELVLKDNLRNLVRGRFKAMRGQVGYKLPVLLESRARAPVDAEEVLFGDDAEADAFIYSLYADMVARRVNEPVVYRCCRPPRSTQTTSRASSPNGRRYLRPTPVRRIFIMLDRLTPPAYFSKYGPRVVPIFNYFQAALVLMGDKHLNGVQVLKVMLELVQTSGYNLLTLSNSFQDLLRRGLPIAGLEALLEAMQGPAAMLQVVRPVPDDRSV